MGNFFQSPLVSSAFLGLVVLLMLRRLQAVPVMQRIFCCLGAGFTIALINSPRDPISGQAIPSDVAHLLVTLMAGVVIVCGVCKVDWKF